MAITAAKAPGADTVIIWTQEWPRDVEDHVEVDSAPGIAAGRCHAPLELADRVIPDSARGALATNDASNGERNRLILVQLGSSVSVRQCHVAR